MQKRGWDCLRYLFSRALTGQSSHRGQLHRQLPSCLPSALLLHTPSQRCAPAVVSSGRKAVALQTPTSIYTTATQLHNLLSSSPQAHVSLSGCQLSEANVKQTKAKWPHSLNNARRLQTPGPLSSAPHGPSNILSAAKGQEHELKGESAPAPLQQHCRQAY